MATITARKVAQVVLMGREMERAEGELRAFIERMNEDEQALLVAIMWIGREAFAADELQEAVATAQREASVPTADYLFGSPHFADHLEAGMEELGVSVLEAEDELMGGH